jgi:DNA-binding transcriptional regulator YiaG
VTTLTNNESYASVPNLADELRLRSTRSQPHRRGVALSLGIALALAGTTTGITSVPQVRPETLRQIRNLTSTEPSGVADLGSEIPTSTRASETPAEMVQKLRDMTGLTWAQLAQLFGVSRRAVHNWANGGRMNARHAELLGQLERTVRDLPGSDAASRRASLLAAGDDGLSIFDRLRGRRASDSSDISGTPFGPEQLIGALHD